MSVKKRQIIDNLYSPKPRFLIFLVAAIGFVVSSASQAAAQPKLVGDGPSALPAMDRVGYASYSEERVSGAFTTDYGYTESVLGENDSHHRFQGRLAASLVPINWLALALRFDGRYDIHSIRGQGDDDGFAGKTNVVARASYELNKAIHFGAETVLWVPGGKTPAKAFKGTSLDLNLIGSFLPGSEEVVISSLAGFRFDNSAHAVNDADTMSLSDRLALSVSEANAVLLGLAESWRAGALEMLAEWTWDLYVGKRAPSVVKSPIRLALGVRWWQSDAFQLEALLGFTPSGRPTVNVDTPLTVIEPRFWIGLSAHYSLPLHQPPKEAKPSLGYVSGRVKTTAGVGISDMQVTVLDIPSLGAVTDKTGSFSVNDVPVGRRTIEFSGNGWQNKSITIAISKGMNQPIEIVFNPTARTLRGVVLTPSKEPIPKATVWIGKGDDGVETQTDDAGRFEFRDVPVESRELKIKADGWEDSIKTLDETAPERLEFEFALARHLPAGQIRGTVHSFDGKPLIATVVIEPVGERLQTNADGTFQADVPPGNYDITVQAVGHKPQKRSVQVEQKGVTVLVIDLTKKR
jgi:hypothetical protein